MLSKLVLIYDKRKELPAKYKKLIESVGASVLIAASTEKSIEILTEYEPDLVLVSDSIDCVAEARKITNRSHALQLIKELCALANVDDDLDDKELDIIIDSAHAMNIEDEKIILINRWVLDSQIVAQTGRIIMEENNG